MRMIPVALSFLGLLAAAPPAPADSLRPVENVMRLSAGKYLVDSAGLRFLVLAPDASQLAALANFDALSEDWSCRFVSVSGERTHIATECKKTP